MTMTSTEIARELGVEQDAVDAIVGMLDDPDLYDPDTDTLSEDGADLVRGQFAAHTSEPATRGDLEELAHVVRQIGAARAVVDDLLDQRDGRVRALLADGIAYRTLEDATGLSRGQLDAIRRGERRRGQ